MARPKISPACRYDVLENVDGKVTIAFDGRMDSATSAGLIKTLQEDLCSNPPSAVRVNLDRVTYFDDFGAIVLFELKHMMSDPGGDFRITDENRRARGILSQVNFDTHERCAPPEKKRSLNIQIGRCNVPQDRR